MAYHHKHNHDSTGRLTFAIIINVILTAAQIIGGILSGSLALVADAIHNLSDAGSIFIAVIANKIGGKSADSHYSYGYQRAEILGAIINSTSLIVVGLYLCYEAVVRYFNPEPIDGWIVVWVASIALIIDVATAWLTYTAGSKESMNIRAAFIHNVSDALASVAVIISGTFVLIYEIYIIDLVATLGISFYVIFHGLMLLKQGVRVIMQGVPVGYDLDKIRSDISKLDGVVGAQHVHLWQLDDKKVYFEGQISVVKDACSCDGLKERIKERVRESCKVDHITVELLTARNLT